MIRNMKKCLLLLLTLAMLLLAFTGCANPNDSGTDRTSGNADTALDETLPETMEETEAETELVIDCPAEGVYIGRTDNLSNVKEIRTDGRYRLRNMVNELTFTSGLADCRADMIIMIDGTYYLCRSASGEINEPVGNLTAVMSEEERKNLNNFFENFSVTTGFSDELLQFTEGNELRELKEYILANGTPCTERRGQFVTDALITNEPHCLVYKGTETLVLTVDSENGCVTAYFMKAKIVFRENGDLYYKMDYPGRLKLEHTTGKGEEYKFTSMSVAYLGSNGGSIDNKPWEWELYHFYRLDEAFRRGFGMNLSLKSLGYLIDETTYRSVIGTNR